MPGPERLLEVAVGSMTAWVVISAARPGWVKLVYWENALDGEGPKRGSEHELPAKALYLGLRAFVGEGYDAP